MNQPRTTGGHPDLSYLDLGPRSAEAVVLLHSLGADGRMWRQQAAVLSERRRVLVPDSRGHGASGWDERVPADGEWPSAWADDLDRVLDDARVGRAALVGVSLGGIQAIAYASSRPERVSGIVVADGFTELEPAVTEARIAALAGRAREQGMAALADSYVADTFTRTPPPDGAEAVRKAIAGMDADRYAAVCAGCFGVRITDRLAAVRAPALVLWGERDAKTPRPLSERIAAGIRGAELRTVPEAGHLSNLENPAEFTRLVEGFLDRIGGS
ncbi:3-oxoadipate enol-lactonase [Actinomadura sp. NBRC 104412]|uniref:alpha/beta fold hydrolase n=1 Tax=Actinomadura sp. NBRC 104412 TaxID=3032203 RepID=UPI0024A03F3C|nr:alpha/beta fold hydrolase [Actinomadura sp. NBRC 104412]GLZ02877.1 3-oxoadipate enol-lactonase [Actinomadura sp. NBRC 104412]